MNLDRVSYGNNAPEEINVIIEIPAHSDPVKYEVDKETGAMFVDRFMNTAMHYPCNYGYIPNTLSEDGDPVDVLVITPIPLVSGSVISCRPISIMPQQLLDQIAHFFDHYKDLEANKWVDIHGWEDRDAAYSEVTSSIERFNNAPVKPCF
jgi:inorganic pyrophosphatase